MSANEPVLNATLRANFSYFALGDMEDYYPEVIEEIFGCEIPQSNKVTVVSGLRQLRIHA